MILDLSSNSFSGNIPASLGNLNKLSLFNVSTNFLTGEIPEGGALSKFNGKSFLGNLKLCGLQVGAICISQLEGPTASPDTFTTPVIGFEGVPPTGFPKKSRHYSTQLLVSALCTVGVSLLVALMCFWGCFLYHRFWKKSKPFHQDVEIKIAPDQKTADAVLPWQARLKIALGAAQGLSYLHHDCSPRIIHRDIKSSNILLGANLEPHVSDFGLAKLLEDHDTHVTTVVAGTFGYLAPEYLLNGKATEKADVYSYGVVLLELLSGKRPTDSSFVEKGLNIVGWVKILVQEMRRTEIIDPLCEYPSTESIDAVLSVAMSCIRSLPDERPTMHMVVKMLKAQSMSPCSSDFYESGSE